MLALHRAAVSHERPTKYLSLAIEHILVSKIAFLKISWRIRQMAPWTDSYVCFPCHSRRSVERIHDPQQSGQRTISCTSCREEMIYIGARIEIPKHDDVKGWDRLYDHVSAYGREGTDEVRSKENEHYRECSLRDGSVGCAKCKEIEKRIPEKITHNGQSRR
jgi:hypothetical protein